MALPYQIPPMVKIIRSVAGIVPDICIEEQHQDQLVITDSPVEGSVMTDHAFKLPSEVIVTYAWSPSGPGNTLAASDFLNDLYNKILAVQFPPVLFDVFTARRIYRNVLLGNVSLTTDKETENALVVRMLIRQVNIAATTILSVSTDPATKADPQSTLPVANQGTQSLQPAPTFDAADFSNIQAGASK